MPKIPRLSNQLEWSILALELSSRAVPKSKRLFPLVKGWRGNFLRDAAPLRGAFFPRSSDSGGPFFTGYLAPFRPPRFCLVLAFEPVEGTSNGRKRVFRAVAAASSVVEWIFLAFPLAAGVTRLRLKYLLVDFATMGTDSLLLSPSLSLSFSSRPTPSRASKNSPSGKKVLRDFPSAFPLASLSRLFAFFHLDGFRR